MDTSHSWFQLMCWITAGRCIDSTCGTETPKPLCLIFGEFNQLSLRLQCSCLQVVSLRDFCIVLLLSSNGLAGVNKKAAHSGTDLLFIEVELTFLIPYVTCIPVYLHIHLIYWPYITIMVHFSSFTKFIRPKTVPVSTATRSGRA